MWRLPSLVVGPDGEAPPSLSLAAPRPNPASGAVRVAFHLPAAGPASVTVLDVLGRHVATLASGALPARAHAVAWDARVAPGVYVVRLATADGVRTQRLTVVR